MTAYDDVPQVSTLYAEQERVTQAIDMLEHGGTMPSFVVGPAPPPPPYVDPRAEAEPMLPMPPAAPVMPVTIMVPGVIDDGLRQALLRSLYEQQDRIAAELEALGVTEVRRAG